jgi:photosystem II stability/assembly factor-like uncharacterized protein
MKTIKLFLGAAIALCLFTFLGCPPTPTVTSNIIARYPFDGNLLDTSGHHHNAMANAPVHFGMDRFGKPGKALILNGRESLTVADSADLRFTRTSSFTISSWIKTSDTSEAGILTKGPTSGPIPGYRLGLRNGRPRAVITAVGGNLDLIGPTSVADDKWHLITVTVSADTVKLYVDTTVVEQRVGAQLRPDSMNTAAMKIGSNPGGENALRGYIDGTSIFGLCLSISEIIHYMGPITIPGPFNMADLPPGIVSGPPPNTTLGMVWLDSLNGYSCGSAGLIQKTVDGGHNWINISVTTSSNIYAVAVDPLGNKVAVGDGGASYYCVSGGVWNSAITSSARNSIGSTIGNYTLSATQINLYDVRFLNGSNVVAVGAVSVPPIWKGIVLFSPDYGHTWSAMRFYGTANVSDGPLYCIAKPQNLQNHFFEVAGSYGLICKCTPINNSWMNGLWSGPPEYTLSSANFASCDFYDDSYGVAVTDAGEVFTSDGWAWISTLFAPTGGGFYAALATSSSGFLIAGDGNFILDQNHTPKPVQQGSTVPNQYEQWLRLAIQPGTPQKIQCLGYTPSPSQFWWLQ